MFLARIRMRANDQETLIWILVPKQIVIKITTKKHRYEFITLLLLVMSFNLIQKKLRRTKLELVRF